MSIYRIQGSAERRQGIFYEFNTDEEPLGAGGMGTVYRGLMVDQATGSTRQVAIKQMFRHLPEQAYLRAKDEASIQLRNDNLIEMLGYIEMEGRSVLGERERDCFVVSELLDGVMLDDLMQGKVTNRYGATVPLAQTLYTDYQRDVYRFAITVVRSVLSGLIAFHDAGYVHRDIDPTNIMVTMDGHVKLIDFGIAKVMHTKTTQSKSLTVNGTFMGKPEYAAPELVRGESLNQDQTTDIYAVGILLFQCIVGHTPFEGDPQAVLHAQVNKKMPLHLIKNRSLREIVGQATEKKRNRRYQSAAEFRVALEKLPLPLKDDTALSLIPWKKVGVAAACVAGALLMGGAAWVVVGNMGSGQEPAVAAVQTAAKEAHEPTPFELAVADLKERSTAAQGLDRLQQLSAGGDSEATFLLSRLYFRSNNEKDVTADSVAQMQVNASIQIDNQKAHRLLLLAVSQDKDNYRALYELGCDYYNTNGRDKNYVRDMDSARACIDQASVLVANTGDEVYKVLIKGMKQTLDSKK